MREYKFRAWDTANERMIDHKNLSVGLKNINIKNNLIKMQYTGLTDKNDKEIFEGDVLRVHEGEVLNYVVESLYCIAFDRINTELYYEIIGNIYENPELLEGE